MKDIHDQLQQICSKEKRVLILGVGNPLQGDDGVGVFITEHLLPELKSFDVISAESTPENFLGKIERLNPDILIMIDAAVFEGAPGAIRLIPSEKILESTASTHQLSLSMIEKFLQHKNPDLDVLFMGIQLVKTEFLDSSLTKPVEEAAQKIIKIFIELDQLRLKERQ